MAKMIGDEGAITEHAQARMKEVSENNQHN